MFVLGAGLNGLSVVRPLGRAGVRCLVFDPAKDDVAYRSRYGTPVVLADRQDATVLAALEERAAGEAQPPVLFATGDPDIRFLVRNRERLAGTFRFVAPPGDSVEIVTDKRRFAGFVEEHGFPSPGTVVAQAAADVERAVAMLAFPVIIKPALSQSWREVGFIERYGNIKIADAADGDQLRAFCEGLLDGGPEGALIIQERIPGADDQQYHYFSYRDRDSREVAGLVARRLRVLPIHGGVGTFVVAEEQPEVRDIARDLLDALRYCGPSSVCFKRHSETAEFKIFEVNGRLPMLHPIFQMCGIDLPGIYYAEAIGRATPAPQKPHNLGRRLMALEMDLRSALEYWRAGELSFFGYLRSLPGTRMVVEFARDDWGPFWYTLRLIAAGLGNLIGKGFSKLRRGRS